MYTIIIVKRTLLAIKNSVYDGFIIYFLYLLFKNNVSDHQYYRHSKLVDI